MAIVLILSFNSNFCALQLVRKTRMVTDVQWSVGFVWMENSVTMSTELVIMVVRLAFTGVIVKWVFHWHWNETYPPKRGNKKENHCCSHPHKCTILQELNYYFHFNRIIFKRVCIQSIENEISEKIVRFYFIVTFIFWWLLRMPSRVIRKKLFEQMQWKMLHIQGL